MIKRLSTLIFPILLIAGFAHAEDISSQDKEKITNFFKRTTFDVIRKGPIPGLIELHAQENIFYYSPETNYAFFGEIVGPDGKSITHMTRIELKKKTQSNKTDKFNKIFSEDIALKDTGIKVGNGPNISVEFTDPDCPYCRQLHMYMEKNKEKYTRYVFLTPIDTLHSQARAKSTQILCNKDIANKLNNVFEGGLDKGRVVVCEEGQERLNKMEEYGKKFNVQGTPMLFVNGTPISGANIEAIEAATK